MIGKLLGHTQVQTTARYAHLARGTVRASASRVGDSIGEALRSTDAPAELDRHGPAGELSGTGDERAQQRYFLGGEVAPAIALDRAGHPDAMSSRRRSSLIDHSSQGDRSSGGLPPFSAQAVSHSLSSAGRRCR